MKGLYATVKEALQSTSQSTSEMSPASSVGASSFQNRPGQVDDYLEAMRALQLDEFENTLGSYPFHYSKDATEHKNMSPKKLSRIAQEMAAMAESLPLSWESTIFLRVDPERVDCMKALISGPEGTPYDSGLYEFDIFLPEEYPNKCPSVHFCTTGGGTARMNPNLYHNGKVCLSLLGTWSGGQGEKWNASTATLLQVLVSIQALILVEHPFFNEPGEELKSGTKEGVRRSCTYNQGIRARLDSPWYPFSAHIHA